MNLRRQTRAPMNILQALLLSTTASVASSASPLTLPYNEKLLGSDGYPMYVDDAAITSTIPWLTGAGKRLSSCLQGMTIPELFHVAFSPTAIDSHSGKARVVNCTHARSADHFECDNAPADETVYFDSSPDQYFILDANTRAGDALELIHAIMTHEVQFPKGVSDPKLDSTKGWIASIAQRGDEFRLTYGGCGCSGNLTVERRRDKNKRWSYVATTNGMGICI